jgi:hypothetical protein
MVYFIAIHYSYAVGIKRLRSGVGTESDNLFSVFMRRPLACPASSAVGCAAARFDFIEGGAEGPLRWKEPYSQRYTDEHRVKSGRVNREQIFIAAIFLRQIKISISIIEI